MEGKKINLKHLKIWGCPAYVKNIDRHKLDARSEKCRFIGYPKESIDITSIILLNKKYLLVGMPFS